MTAAAVTPVERQLAPAGGWIPAPAGSPRIPPLRAAELRWWERLLFWALLRFKAPASANRQLPVLFATLLRHRRLFYAWLRFASRLMPGGSLERRDAELVILRVGWTSRCRYEWGQHVAIGLASGLQAGEIARVALGPQAAGWQPRQQALLQAVDELHLEHAIRTATWQALCTHFREAQLIELTLLAGHYRMLAGAINSLGLALEPDVEDALARAPIHGAASAVA